VRSLFRLATVWLVPSTIAACAHGRPDHSPSPTTPITVSISNNGTLDADITASGSGGRYHLGLVPAEAAATLYLPSYVVSSGALRLFVQPVGGSMWWTPVVHVQPGANAVLQLSSPIEQSTFGVGPPD